MDIQFGSQIIKSYKRLSYTAWHALAEFVDNSTSSYLNNKAKLDTVLGEESPSVEFTHYPTESKIEILDNCMGMSKLELENAVIVGHIPHDSTGRSRYGLGMKTASCWLGNKWTVETKKLGETASHFIEIDVDRVANGDTDLQYKKTDNLDENEHFTKITIYDLNRNLVGKTIAKIKTFLRSMYRVDITEYDLELFWDDELLAWDYDDMIFNRLYVGRDEKKKKRDFAFAIGEEENLKNVTGWVGVYEQGSRKDAGFSIIQAKRVIKGWPNSYRPETVFGEERNDLVNQRLVGEIFLDENFAVSHTKDEILFNDQEEEEFEDKIYDECEDFRSFALEHRKYLDDERIPSEQQSSRALNEFEEELRSDILTNKVENNIIPEKSQIDKINSVLIGAVIDRMDASAAVNVGGLEVLIYIDASLSPNDPYVLIETTNDKQVIIVINSAHPHWSYLSSNSDILNFIRHSTYDGIAEWKAISYAGRIDSNTIKYVKDDLLRVPFEIESSEY